MKFKILYILIVFQLIFSQLIGFGAFYYFLGGYLIFVELINFDFTKKINNKSYFFLIYLIFTFLLLVCNLIIDFNLDKIIMYVSLLWLPLLLFLKSNNSGFKADSFFRLHIILSLIGAFAGIIEFHISRDIFGLVPKVGYLELYDNFELFYRTRSIFLAHK